MSIEEKLELAASSAEMMPGVIVIHKLDDFSPVHMNSHGLELLGLDLEELQALGPDYTPRFLNDEDMQPFLIKLKRLLHQNDPKQTFTFSHQVKLAGRDTWSWYLSSINIFHQDEQGNPTHTITVAFPIDDFEQATAKAEKLLSETAFARENLEKFLSLGKRGKQILQLVARGKSSAEIAAELNISVDTVNSHRKKIKQKLRISSNYEFSEYARAYDLI